MKSETAPAIGGATIVWFRQDLRLADNPALAAASNQGTPVVPLFVFAPEEEAAWAPGGASKWWLSRSLTALADALQGIGSRLIIRKGASLEILQQLASETKATAVFWNRRYEPVIRDRDNLIKSSLSRLGLKTESFAAALLNEPWTIQNKSGKPFQVFTPFWRHCLSLPEPPHPIPAPGRLCPPGRWPDSLRVTDLQLDPVPNWAGGLQSTWQPGEAGGSAQLERFLPDRFETYKTSRDRPDLPGTSRLSPHLHFGEISPRQIWHALKQKFGSREPASTREGLRKAATPATPSPPPPWRQSQFLTELGWREFSHHLIYHFPHTDREPLRPEFRNFRWHKNPEALIAWQRGRTGYPLVDAGMRELWSTGWMHNRVRMVVGSFLVKDLLVDWQEGARWFWDTLVDADLAQNTLGWQWTAGCGADAAPFFRVFNPISQGEKFDPLGHYVRRWVPELAALPNEWIHKPFDAPPEIRTQSGVELGKTYPAPIISHVIAREVALEAYSRLRSGTEQI